VVSWTLLRVGGFLPKTSVAASYLPVRISRCDSVNYCNDEFDLSRKAPTLTVHTAACSDVGLTARSIDLPA
jgi:hypothetical protein